MTEKNKIEEMFIPIIAAIVGAFIYFYNSSDNENVAVYIKGIIMSAIIFFAAFFLSKKMAIKVPNNKIVAFALLLLSGVYFAMGYFVETVDNAFPTNYIRHRIPPYVYAIILILSTALSVILILRSRGSIIAVRLLFVFLIVFLQMGFMCSFNPFMDDLFHISFYTDSIFKVIDDLPYGDMIPNVYGHYALLLKAPIELIHIVCSCNYWYATVLAIALSGGIAFFCIYFFIGKVIKNDVIFFLMILAISSISFQVFLYQQYYQLLPHRLVFQGITMLGIYYVASSVGKRRFAFKVLVWVIVSLSILWNSETGLVFLLVWFCSNTYLDIANKKERGWVWGTLYLIKNVLLSIIVLFAGWIVVVIDTIQKGAKPINFYNYVFPGSYYAPTYFAESFNTPLKPPTSLWFLMLAVFLAVLFFYLPNLFRRKSDVKELMAIVASVMGIGLFIYYINYPHGQHWTISIFPFVFLVGFLCERAYCIENNGFFTMKGVVLLTSSLILTAMSIGSICSFGESIYWKENDPWDTSGMTEFAGRVNSNIPEDTVMIGLGTGILSKFLNKEQTDIVEPGWWGAAPTAASSEETERLEQPIRNGMYKYLLVPSGWSDGIPESYKEEKTFEYGYTVFSLYRLDD